MFGLVKKNTYVFIHVLQILSTVNTGFGMYFIKFVIAIFPRMDLIIINNFP